MANQATPFPQWNPSRWTIKKFKSISTLRSTMLIKDFKKLKNQFRNSCDGFIARPDVRKIIFERDGYKCKACGATDNLTIDHIIGVSQAFANIEYPVMLINIESNLQTLCKTCNCKKA